MIIVHLCWCCNDVILTSAWVITDVSEDCETVCAMKDIAGAMM